MSPRLYWSDNCSEVLMVQTGASKRQPYPMSEDKSMSLLVR